MADENSKGESIDSMSEEQLATALDNDIKTLDGKPTDEQSSDQNSNNDDTEAGSDESDKSKDTKPSENSSEENQDNAGEKPDDKKNNTVAKDGDGQKGDDGEVKNSGQKKQSRATKRIIDLTHQRESAKEQVNEKDDVIKKKDKEIDDLKKQIDGDDEFDDLDDDEKIEKMADKKAEEKISQNESEKSESDRKETLDKNEISQLFKDKPNAKEYEDDIKELAGKHPTLSFNGIYRMLNPNDYIDEAADNQGDSQKTSSDGNTHGGLQSDKTAKDMTGDELEQHLRDEVNSGNMEL